MNHSLNKFTSLRSAKKFILKAKADVKWFYCSTIQIALASAANTVHLHEMHIISILHGNGGQHRANKLIDVLLT